MILSGELAFGEQAPQRVGGGEDGRSRTVVTAGLVEARKARLCGDQSPAGGVLYVCDYRRRGTMETLVAIMRYNGGALRQNEVRSLLETRDAMECMCMRLVVERSDTASLEALAPVLESIRTARDSDEAAENVFLFHHELAVLSGNVLIPAFYTTPSARRACISGRSTASAAAYRKCMNRSSRSIPPRTVTRPQRYVLPTNASHAPSKRCPSSAHKNVPRFPSGKAGTTPTGGFHRSFLGPQAPSKVLQIAAARAHGDVRFACAVAVAAAGNAHAVCSRGGRLHSYLLFI